jgi:hypothetical protein
MFAAHLVLAARGHGQEVAPGLVGLARARDSVLSGFLSGGQRRDCARLRARVPARPDRVVGRSFACKRCGGLLNPKSFRVCASRAANLANAVGAHAQSRVAQEVKGKPYCVECVDRNPSLYQEYRQSVKAPSRANTARSTSPKPPAGARQEDAAEAKQPQHRPPPPPRDGAFAPPLTLALALRASHRRVALGNPPAAAAAPHGGAGAPAKAAQFVACPSCGTQGRLGKFCTQCGKRLPSSAQPGGCCVLM